MNGRWGWVVTMAIVIDMGALASVWISQSHGRRAKIVWTVLVLALPILGGVAWFVAGHERKRP